jgi:hypothetical protein
MYYTIYKITNQINGKFYIGSHKTKDLDDNYMGSGKYLKHAQEKYGIENFKKEILFIFDTAEEMYAKEAEIVNEEFLSEENTYNLKVGGFGGFDYINNRGFVRNDSHFKEGNDTSKKGGKVTYNKKVAIHSDENKNKAKKVRERLYPKGTFYGKKHSSEVKKIIGEKNSNHQNGEKNSQFGTMWITNEVFNLKIRREKPIPEGFRKGRV